MGAMARRMVEYCHVRPVCNQRMNDALPVYSSHVTCVKSRVNEGSLLKTPDTLRRGSFPARSQRRSCSLRLSPSIDRSSRTLASASASWSYSSHPSAAHTAACRHASGASLWGRVAGAWTRAATRCRPIRPRRMPRIDRLPPSAR
eukprot:scaffold121447_cov23-Tisochrysis_lutea.AAC.1